MVAACPFPANYGSPASIREMSITLARMGHEVFVLTYPYGQNLPLEGVHLIRVGKQAEKEIKVGPSWRKPFQDLRMVFALVSLIRRERIDVIHAHNYEGALVGILGKWLTRTPLLYNAVNTMRDELAEYKFIRPKFLSDALAKSLDWFVPRPADFITAVSKELEAQLVREGIPAHKVTTVPAGVHPELFDNQDGQRFRRELGLGNTPIVMYAGTLGGFQGIPNLYKAFVEVLKEVPNARLAMVMPIDESAALVQERARTRELGFEDRVIWAGPHPLADLPDYMAMADVTVVPRPDCPGHPVKLLNYMTAGRAIVTFAGSAKGIENEVNGLVVPDHDCVAMGKAIARLLKDAPLRQRLGAAARETLLREYTWTSICRKIVSCYHRILPATNTPSKNKTECERTGTVA
jgi:glycosyltransferase involved in cell wall biosynthesis